MIAKEHSRFRLLLLQSLNICQPLNIKVILVQSLKQIGTPYLLNWSPGCCPQLRHEAGFVLLLLPLLKPSTTAGGCGRTPPLPLLHGCRQVDYFLLLLILLPRPPNWCGGGGYSSTRGRHLLSPISIQRRGGSIFHTLLGTLTKNENGRGG